MTVHPDHAGIHGDELRALVREVVRDLLPTLRGAAREPGHHTEAVAIGGDDDLNAFALRVLELARDPARAADIRDGRLRFRLSVPAPDTPPARAVHRGDDAPVRRHEKGAVTERHVAEAAEAGARLVLGRRAVLTPLAKERARACGLVVEREG
ncbi:hypothetical protein OG589_06475 [Sphaerisporangium sp. NBC_01403]|uniref:hypothetical protein n=1 Tax=Sphaerisporangium sp. NBC_01403 TaxID=2903599 RepID=UPI00324A9778